eukprot:CAMPEP_0170738680 /NCGR_PEP_ID=MMETSP0437-20130122/4769_1 /TAXON_ID=0 /ORGANISM="Sexangularia sp." /LENGTH=145 /DNA_ID=CAMNT_0011077109 /DNA_START=68 /DNA_END=505 /DNA_ORIENTATION=+
MISHVIAVDGSENSEWAFDYADRVFPKDHKFILFHGRSQTTNIAGNVKAAHTRDRLEHHGILDHFLEKCKESGRECSMRDPPHRSVSHLAENICIVGSNPEVASIVMGSRGLSSVQRAFLGSVSAAVVQSCEHPVTIVREPTKKE